MGVVSEYVGEALLCDEDGMIEGPTGPFPCTGSASTRFGTFKCVNPIHTVEWWTEKKA